MTNKITIKNRIKTVHVVSTATINFGILTQKRFWVKIPKSQQSSLTTLSDPWVNILLFKMMEIGGKFYISGKVSESLIYNAEMFSLIWNKWLPNKYKPIKIIPDSIYYTQRANKNKNLITAFSGGLDAAYTAYKYKNHLQNGKKYNFDSCVIIHGADIPVHDTKGFNNAFKSAKKMTDDLHLKLIPVITNYRSYKCNWGYEFGAVISGVLSFFSKKFAFGAATDASVDNFKCPWGMNLISDKFLSSNNFTFFSDGIEHNRMERLQTIKDWKACLQNMRVCWENKDKSKNCGHCEKCIRTKLEFLALGIDHLPTMPTDFSYKDLGQKYIIHSEHNIMFFQEILDYAKTHKTFTEKEIMLLAKQIKKWNKLFSDQRKHHHSFWWHLLHLKF